MQSEPCLFQPRTLGVSSFNTPRSWGKACGSAPYTRPTSGREVPLEAPVRGLFVERKELPEGDTWQRRPLKEAGFSQSRTSPKASPKARSSQEVRRARGSELSPPFRACSVVSLLRNRDPEATPVLILHPVLGSMGGFPPHHQATLSRQLGV